MSEMSESGGKTLPLLVEFLTEELPPQNQEKIFGGDFATNLENELRDFKTSSSKTEYFVTPRRFAVIITDLRPHEQSKQITRKGPAIAAGIIDNVVQPALQGFMRSCGIDNIDQLSQSDGYFYFTTTALGRSLAATIPLALTSSLKKLNIAKTMTWGEDYSFARPVHNILLLHGSETICDFPIAFGLRAVNFSYGHRVMSSGMIVINNALDYKTQMAEQGFVVASFNQRKELIKNMLQQEANKLDLVLLEDDLTQLLTEVTGLVEYPVVLTGKFNPKYLDTPQECLILSMAKNQKYFACLTQEGVLSNQFLFVANLESLKPDVVIKGNEQVLTARLADAEFFYNTDKNHDLVYFNNKLANMVYHNKLGSQSERIKRLLAIALKIADLLAVDASKVTKAVNWLKMDLATEMVGEFSELQGVMGKYYAKNAGVEDEVAESIEKHYWPKFSGDKLPDTPLAITLALADKLETIVGMWGIGLIPSGEKDPFALRRNALGIARVLLENDLDILQLLKIAATTFESDQLFNHSAVQIGDVILNQVVVDVYNFIMQRLMVYMTRELGLKQNIVNAILKSYRFDLNYNLRLLRSFKSIIEIYQLLEQFVSNDNTELFQANKRIENILKKNQVKNKFKQDQIFANLQVNVEKQLFDYLQTIMLPLDDSRSWQDYLTKLAGCGPLLADFFANVMVMCENVELRDARLGLLLTAQEKFNYLCNLAILGEV